MITVVGQLADELGAAFQTLVVDSRDPARSFDVEHRAASFSSLEYRRTQPAPIMVDVEHEGPPVGTVRYLERAVNGKLFAVCEVDASGLGDGPWYFSPEITHVEGRDITLDALAFTRSPSSIGLSALVAFGGLLATAARRVVHQDGLPGAQVKRAQEYNRCRRRGEPLVIADLAREARIGKLVGRSASDPAVAIEYAQLLDDERPPGPVRHGPVVRGSVLRVS